jgi:hypothetical protein
MDNFGWIAVVVSLILGLGVARLLISALAIFRARRRAILDWPPLVWAATIFLQEVAFWWSLEEAASRVTTWTLPTFLVLVGLVLALFVAASLILPVDEMAEGESLRAYFEEDGRWALLALGAFNLVVALMNFALRSQGKLTEQAVINLLLAAVSLAAFFGPRRVQLVASAACLPLIVWGVARLTP